MRAKKLSKAIPSVAFGTVIGGDFMIVRPIGRGSTGALYAAEQLSTSSLRALKLMRAEYASDPTLLKRFEREAQAAARIPSEHVAHVIAAGIDRKLQLPWIAMELLEGQHLAHYVEERGPLDARSVRDFVEQLCHALAAAHELGIVHRDLRPENVFVGEARRVGAERVVKVLDFGLAKIIADTVPLTLQGSVLGTPSWMAPEQATGGPVTAAADVWAVGLLAFYMLTGKAFWLASQRDDAPAVLAEILEAPIPIAWGRASELGVGERIPRGFSEWFAQCVTRQPEHRFVNAAAAYAALSSALP